MSESGADSHQSAIESPSRSSAEWISNSQQKHSTLRSPQVAHNHIVMALAAGQNLLAVSSIEEGTDIPAAFCDRGHRIKWSAKFAAGSSYVCHFCERAYSKGLFTCHCGQRNAAPFFACLECLKAGESYLPPPNCPSKPCGGTCTRRFSSYNKPCPQCKTSIVAGAHSWHCPKCRSITCDLCCPPTARAEPSAIPSSPSSSAVMPQPSTHQACSVSKFSSLKGPSVPPDDN